MSSTRTIRYLNADPDWSRTLECIRTEGPIATEDIARATGLDSRRVTGMIRAMRFDGFVVKASATPAGASLWKAKGL